MTRAVELDPIIGDRRRPSWPPRPAGHPDLELLARYYGDGRDLPGTDDDQRSR